MNRQHCSVGIFGEVVDQIAYLLRRSQNLGASNRTPPSTTTDKTRNTVNRCVGMEKEGCEGDKQEKVTLLLSLPSFLLVIIDYNKSIVIYKGMIVLMYCIPLIVAV